MDDIQRLFRTTKDQRRRVLRDKVLPPSNASLEHAVSPYRFSTMLSPALIRNIEGDNISASSTTTLLEIGFISGTEITLTGLTAANLIALDALIDKSVDWFVQSLDDFNSTEPGYTGDYTVQSKVTSFDIVGNGKINVADATGFTVGDNICLYSPWVNYTFLSGQESEGIVKWDAGVAWRNDYVTPGPSWYDPDNERYVVIVNGRGASGYQIGFAYSTDLSTWTIGNSDAPIIEFADDTNFANNVWGSGNAIELSTGKMAFTINGYDASNNPFVHVVQMDKDCTNISWGSAVLTGHDYFAGALTYYNGKYVIVATNRDSANVYEWTVEMWESATVDSGYSKTTDVFTTEYDTNDSVWLEGHADAHCLFVEHGKLYNLIAGTQRYTISGIQGNRTYGLMEYDGSTWSIVNDYAPEIIHPMYVYNITGEDYDWAGGHCGGYMSFVKRAGKCYAFLSFLYTARTYQVGVLDLTKR